MGTFFAKRVLTIYWIEALIHCFFQYVQLPYVAVKKPMLVPLLFVYILLEDEDISRRAVVSFIVPVVLIFLIENILVAANKFHYNRNKNIFAAAMFTYSLAQNLIVKGMRRIYL